MAEVAVSMALQTLVGILKKEVKFLYGVSDHVKELEMQLSEMQCLLRDADKRKFESATVANWISKMRDLAHRAEDTIEEYAFDISSKRGRGFKWLLHRFGGALKECSVVHQIGSEILKIKSEFEAITKSMQEYGIRSIIYGESSTSMDDNQQWKRKTFPFENDECFVGKEDELQQLVSLVINEQHKVISIWGMGGLGKTTIARKVYNHHDVKCSFKSFAWVCVTKNFQIQSVLIDILRQLRQKANEDVTKLSNEELVEQLCNIQSREHCLIVCDDIWEEVHWDGLKKHAFSVKGSKSKILLTTRIKNVADKGYTFKLGFLTLDDGWELLKNKAFLCDTTSTVLANDEKAFEEIGKDMVKRCGNLPLVISLLGGVLSKKNSKEEWKVVHSNIDVYLGWGGEGTGEKNGIQDVLNLSYEELPYYLKPCFLLMAQYGEDVSITIHGLLMSWIAQGMIVENHQRKDMTLIDVAELYLSELSSRCLVIVEVEKSIKKLTTKCYLHDMVRDLCLSKVKLEDFRVNSICYRGGKFSTLWNEILSDTKMRYLNVDFAEDIEPEDGGYINTDGYAVKYIRGLDLYYFSKEKTIEFPHNVVQLCRFKLLKELSLVRFSFSRRKLPKQIGYLIHLQHLCLVECKMDKLPSSIRNLANLTFLHLPGTKNVKIPNVIKKFPLKDLCLPTYDTETISKYHLALDGLDEMETLHCFNTLVHNVKSLKTMKKMRSFEANIHDNRSLSLIIDTIANDWKYLCSCDLTIDGGCQFIGIEDDKGLEILRSIFTFTCELAVELRTYIGAMLHMCETEIVTSGLVHLSLKDCRIDNDPMEIFGKIPLLKKLEFYNDSFLGEEMKCHSSGFLRLKKLTLDGLPNLRQWNVEQGAMPHLSSIKICRCSQLEMIPDGLKFIKTLQKLKIVGILQLERRVFPSSKDRGEGEDYDKVRHVRSIIIEDQGE